MFKKLEVYFFTIYLFTSHVVRLFTTIFVLQVKLIKNVHSYNFQITKFHHIIIRNAKLNNVKRTPIHWLEKYTSPWPNWLSCIRSISKESSLCTHRSQDNQDLLLLEVASYKLICRSVATERVKKDFCTPVQ